MCMVQNSQNNQDEIGVEFEKFAVPHLENKFEEILGKPIKIQLYRSINKQYNVGDGVIHINRKKTDPIEIKLDRRFTKNKETGKKGTNQLAIEVAEKRKSTNENWIPSGILKKDKVIWYIQGNYDIIFIFKKKDLIKLYEEYYKNHCHESHGTIRKFYLSSFDAREIAYGIINLSKIKKEKQNSKLISNSEGFFTYEQYKAPSLEKFYDKNKRK